MPSDVVGQSAATQRDAPSSSRGSRATDGGDEDGSVVGGGAAGDAEEGEIGGNDDSQWVVDTQPQKPSKKRRRAKAAERAGAQAAQSGSDPAHGAAAAADFMALDTNGDAKVKDDGRPEEEAGRGESEAAGTSSTPSGLLLPDHVQVQQDRKRQQQRRGSASGSSASPPPGLEDLQDPDADAQGHLGDFTQLDADTSGMTRYYQAAEAEERKALRSCEICGEKGHVKRECSHLLCASCGATDEHTTRDCPVGVSCFRCGQRGHRRNECTADLRRTYRSRDCRRCGSLNHNENACPTYWRIYAYVDEEEWQQFRAKKARKMDAEREKQGGRLRASKRTSSDMDTDDDEGDAEDDDDAYTSSRRFTHREDWDPAQRWCYNCTARGTHWGDDCPLPRRAHGRNGEPSIFSEFISMSGPFAYRLQPAPTQHVNAAAKYSAPTADMYDVSVGPNTSMHISGNRRGGGGGPATIEEEVDRIFARAPRGPRPRGRVEREEPPASRGRRRGEEPSRRPLEDRLSSTSTPNSSGLLIKGKAVPPTRPRPTTGQSTTGAQTTTATTSVNGSATNGSITGGSSFNHRAKVDRGVRQAERDRRGGGGGIDDGRVSDDESDADDDDVSSRRRGRKRKTLLEEYTTASTNGKRRNANNRRNSPISISSDDDSDDVDYNRRRHPSSRSNPATAPSRPLTSRELQSLRDKAAHARRIELKAQEKQRKGQADGEARFGPFAGGKQTKLAIDEDWQGTSYDAMSKQRRKHKQKGGESKKNSNKSNASQAKSAKTKTKSSASAAVKGGKPAKSGPAKQKQNKSKPPAKGGKGSTQKKGGPMYKGGYD